MMMRCSGLHFVANLKLLVVFIGLILSTTSCLEFDCCTPPIQGARLFLGAQEARGTGIRLKVGESVTLTLKVGAQSNFVEENPIVYLYTSRTCQGIQNISELQMLQNMPEVAIKFAGSVINPSNKILPTQITSRTGELSFVATGLSSTTTPYFGGKCLIFIVDFAKPQLPPSILPFFSGAAEIEVI
jgi:hypothetical protein